MTFPPNWSCLLTKPDIHGKNGSSVRHQKLIVEATLTASCIPVLLRGPLIMEREVRCRDSDLPQRSHLAPVLGRPVATVQITQNAQA